MRLPQVNGEAHDLFRISLILEHMPQGFDWDPRQCVNPAWRACARMNRRSKRPFPLMLEP